MPETTRTLSDYLTDGSLAALVEELSRLSSVKVELRDGDGRLIVPAKGSRPWAVVGESPPVDPRAAVYPLRLGGKAIGSLAVHTGEPRLAEGAAASLRRVVELLARASAELIDYESELRIRIKELSALFRLSSLLSRADNEEEVLHAALDAALEALELDAGNVVLLKEDADGIVSRNEEDVVTRASRGLSRGWIESDLPLAKDRLFDRLALRGEVVVSSNIENDERILITDRARAEGLGAAIHAGMIFHGRPIGVVRLYSRVPREFNESEKRLLANIAQQAAVGVEQSRLMRFREEEQETQRQLSLAADVQRRMMPRGNPMIPGLEVATRYVPSLELGGDFYDVFDLNGHLAIAIGDVVGKGVAAALLMSAVRASLRAYVQDLYDLDEVISRVNGALCRDTHDREFATLWYGVVDPKTLRLTYCSAGHEPPLAIRAAGKGGKRDVEELSVGGMAVGIDPQQRYQRSLFDLRPRDVLVAYTDGMLDARNFAGERFGRARFRDSVLRVLADEPDAPANRIAEQIQWDLRRFTGLRERPDDQTLVVMRVLAR